MLGLYSMIRDLSKNTGFIADMGLVAGSRFSHRGSQRDEIAHWREKPWQLLRDIPQFDSGLLKTNIYLSESTDQFGDRPLSIKELVEFGLIIRAGNSSGYEMYSSNQYLRSVAYKVYGKILDRLLASAMMLTGSQLWKIVEAELNSEIQQNPPISNMIDRLTPRIVLSLAIKLDDLGQVHWNDQRGDGPVEELSMEEKEEVELEKVLLYRVRSFKDEKEKSLTGVPLVSDQGDISKSMASFFQEIEMRI